MAIWTWLPDYLHLRILKYQMVKLMYFSEKTAFKLQIRSQGNNHWEMHGFIH